MATFNRVILAGNLTRDVELRYLPSGDEVASFSLAVNESKKGGKEKDVHYFDVTVFGKTAAAVAEFIGKGSPVLIEGRLRQERWEKDGQKFSRVKVIANNVQFLADKKKSGAEAPPPDQEDIPF